MTPSSLKKDLINITISDKNDSFSNGKLSFEFIFGFYRNTIIKTRINAIMI